MTMDQAAYSAYYASLALQSGQIRLVTVDPARSWDDPVTCVIDVFDLSEHPDYHAISYTWGGQSAEHPVVCDGNIILVTQSCIDALKGIRHQALHVVWIDQLSISQLDDEERGAQIMLMDQIYSQAAMVNVSLGDWASKLAEESRCFREEVEVDEASGRIVRTFIHPTPLGDGKFEDLKIKGPVSAVHASVAVADQLLRELASYLVSTTHWERLKPLAAVPTAWKIVADVLSNPYWRRKWIIQEIGLNPNVRIMIGSFYVRFEDVLGAFVMVNRIVHPQVNVENDELQFRRHAEPFLEVLASLAQPQVSCLLAIGQAIMALRERNLSKLFLRLSRPSYFETTWDIDAVYAVRALMKDYGQAPQPRYSNPEPRAVFVEYSRWFVERGFGAEVLIARSFDGVSLATLEHPSWSINWTSGHMTISKETLSYNPSYFCGHDQHRPRQAATPTRSEDLVAASQNITVFADSDKVRIFGSMIGVVAHALPQAEGCRSSLTLDQVWEFMFQARTRRSVETQSWIRDYLISTERDTQGRPFMKTHRALLEGLEELAENNWTDTESAESTARALFERETNLMHHWTFLVTAQGLTGIGPEHMKDGDVLVNVDGLGDVAFVLRKQGSDIEREYILVGQAEVIAHAGEHGQALAMSRNSEEFVVC